MKVKLTPNKNGTFNLTFTQITEGKLLNLTRAIQTQADSGSALSHDLVCAIKDASVGVVL